MPHLTATDIEFMVRIALAAGMRWVSLFHGRLGQHIRRGWRH
jgi:hypothetical protein